MKSFPLRFIYLFIIFCFTSFYSFSQGNTGIFAGGGIMYYNGDLGDKADKIFTHPVFFKPYACLGVSYWFAGHIESSLSFTHGKVCGADSVSSEKNNLSRNLSFESSIDELSLRIELNSLHRYEKSLMNAFVFTGISAFRFNPKAKLDNTWYELQPLGTEGQYINGEGYPEPYKLMQFSVPAGFGLAVRLSRMVRLKATFCHNFLFTDYLDDVSTKYPDLESLSSTSNGELAVALSSRKLNEKYPAAGSPRGSAKYKDAYTTIGLSLIYNPGISKCPATFKTTKIRRQH